MDGPNGCKSQTRFLRSTKGEWLVGRSNGLGRSFMDGRALAEPGEINVPGRRLIVPVVITRSSGDGALVPPAVAFDMAVGKGNNAAAIMGTVGKIEKLCSINLDFINSFLLLYFFNII